MEEVDVFKKTTSNQESVRQNKEASGLQSLEMLAMLVFMCELVFDRLPP